MSILADKTLEELEGAGYGEPDYDSYLVTTCHHLVKVPIGQLSVEDLRILIGQSIGVTYLVPLALDILEANPLAEGDFYPGDLLGSVLRLDRRIWKEHPDWAERLELIADTVVGVPTEIRSKCESFLLRDAIG